MNEPGFTDAVDEILNIFEDLDNFDRPKRKLPNCPKCDEDELGVIHADLLLCYWCGWKIEGRGKALERTAAEQGEITKLKEETHG